MGADGRAKKTIWGQFWSAHQVSTIIMIMITMMTITVIISVVIDVIATNRELKHATFLSHERQPEVRCFRI